MQSAMASGPKLNEGGAVAGFCYPILCRHVAGVQVYAERGPAPWGNAGGRSGWGPSREYAAEATETTCQMKAWGRRALSEPPVGVFRMERREARDASRHPVGKKRRRGPRGDVKAEVSQRGWRRKRDENERCS
jgi:hypothetical protein